MQKTAFNATGKEVAITSEKLDGTNAVTEMATADITAGQPWGSRLLTEDRAYYVVYTVGTGGTTGDIHSFAKVSGAGPTN